MFTFKIIYEKKKYHFCIIETIKVDIYKSRTELKSKLIIIPKYRLFFIKSKL